MSTLPTYPAGSVRALLTTDHVSLATRAALTERLEASQHPWTLHFFTETEFILLRAICTRLTGADDLATTIDVARSIDKRLGAGDGDGWRYAEFPDDRVAWRVGVQGIEIETRTRFDNSFVELSGDEQDATLRAIQSGETSTTNWHDIPPDRFFTELLTEVSQAFYGHPLAQEEIGYVGMADLPGWQSIGLNQLDEREPRAIQGNNVNA